MVVPRVMWAVALLFLASHVARADDTLAREKFLAGVTAAEEQRWADAALHFEGSLAESDMPSTRFNLVLAYSELGQPLLVVLHGLRLLEGPATEAREQARAHASLLVKQAIRSLATLTVATLPAGADLRIDGAPPVLRSEAGIYLLPGAHHLELRLGSKQESIEISLAGGQVLPWPRVARSAQAGDELPAPRSAPTAPVVKKATVREDTPPISRLRKRTAWSLGMVGAALAVAASGCLVVAQLRAENLASRGIPGTLQMGYKQHVDGYLNTLDAVMPLAFAGGVLMSGALLVSEHATERGSLEWSVASVVLATAFLSVGTYLMVREPKAVIPTSDLERPSRNGGGLLVALSLPLLTYGIGAALSHWRGRRSVALRALSSGVTW
jgi:hypothetical protein